MSKVKIPKVGLMILTSVFYLHLTGLTVADECWNREGGGPTITGNHTYPSGWFPEFQYDPNNPDEIDRNSSVTISVIGGTQPYTWEVSGTGFIIPSSTTDRTNTLSADNTSCGAATIIVKDKYGASCTGYVRCTTGSWHQHCGCNLSWVGGASSGSGCSVSDPTIEVIVGKWKYSTVDNPAYDCRCHANGGTGSYGGAAGSDPESHHDLGCDTGGCASGDCWRNTIDVYEWQ
jgi:hypothetical protein